MANSNSENHSDLLFNYNSCNILLKQGNLLDEDNVELIVIPAPPSKESDPGSFAIFNQFNQRADDDLKRDVERIRRELTPEQARRVMKHNRGYIFVLLPYLNNDKRAHDLIKKNYSSCLKLAVANDARSVAFPTIGCGNRGFEPAKVASLAFSVFEDFLGTNDGKKLDEIRIVVYSNDVWKTFTQTFLDRAMEKKSKIKFKDSVSKKSTMIETSRQPLQPEHSQDYPDDFENYAPAQAINVKKVTTPLNPDASEFKPKSSNTVTRNLRRYYINENQTELHIIQGDILQIKVDVIVNATNEDMSGGSGVDGAIHKAAGIKFDNACQSHKEIYPGVRLPTGRSCILLSYDMRPTTHYIINTAGPKYDNSSPDQCKKDLASCYQTSLQLANMYHLETIAFTGISCGMSGYPINECAEVALQTVNSKVERMKTIIFVLKNDDIYDAWVQKAKELRLKSMDKTDDEPTTQPEERSTHKPQSDNNQHSNEQSPSKSKKTVEPKEDKSNKAENSAEKNDKHKNGQASAGPTKDSNKSIVNSGVGLGRGRGRLPDQNKKS